jgi:hypothetical protein
LWSAPWLLFSSEFVRQPHELPQRVYLSGPMTGLPDDNFPAFHAMTERLRKGFCQVFNPAESFAGKHGLPRKVYMRHDIGALLDCRSIVLLPGWHRSRGVMMELHVAYDLDYPIFSFDTESGVFYRRYFEEPS